MLPLTSAAAADLRIKNVTGVLADGGRFDGSLRIENLGVQKVGNGFVTTLQGTLRGTATRADGSTEEVRESFTAPVDIAKLGPNLGKKVCQIIELDIGAIHLDVLGLVIDLSPIQLDVTAVPGGGLLGDLLCSLSDLLSGLPEIGQVTRLIGSTHCSAVCSPEGRALPRAGLDLHSGWRTQSQCAGARLWEQVGWPASFCA